MYAHDMLIRRSNINTSVMHAYANTQRSRFVAWRAWQPLVLASGWTVPSYIYVISVNVLLSYPCAALYIQGHIT